MNSNMFKVKKKTIDYEVKSIRMPSYMVDKVQSIADASDISFNSLVVQCIDYALSNMDTEETSPKDMCVK